MDSWQKKRVATNARIKKERRQSNDYLIRKRRDSWMRGKKDCKLRVKNNIMIQYKEESYNIIGICMEVHNNLGAGFLEIVYKDALEYEFKKANIPYERERKYEVNYKGVILPHKFYADFVVYDNIILEIKGVKSIPDEFLAQGLNYLKVSNNKLALVVNFGELRLNYKRVVL